MLRFSKEELDFLEPYHLDMDFSKLSEDECMKLEDFVIGEIQKYLKAPKYEATKESVILQHILEKIWE